MIKVMQNKKNSIFEGLKTLLGFDVEADFNERIRKIIEIVLNTYLDAEADMICSAKRYERTNVRKSTRAGSYTRKYLTANGMVDLKIPKLRDVSFKTDVFNRYQRHESSMEAAFSEMYFAGVSDRKIGHIVKTLCGTNISASTVSRLVKDTAEKMESWRNAKLDSHYVYVFVDGVWLKRTWGKEVANVSILVAVGVKEHGEREIIGVSEGSREDSESWRNFLRYLKDRGLKSIDLLISDCSPGLVNIIPEFFPEAKWQRCMVHWMRNAFSHCPAKHLSELAAMLKAIHEQEDRDAAISKAKDVCAKLRNMNLDKLASFIESSLEEVLTYMDFPREHWKRIRTNNIMERLMKEIRRRTRVIGCFPTNQSAILIVCDRLRCHTESWSDRVYISFDKHLNK